jgi:ATP-binding cassette subfamily B protein
MLLRFHDPQHGAISVDGIDIARARSRACANAIALVPQSPTIFAASAADNIRYGRLEADETNSAAARSAEAHEFIEALPQGYAANWANAARACPVASSNASPSLARC